MTSNRRAIDADLINLRRAPAQMSVLAAHYKQVMRDLYAERPYLMPAEFNRRLAQAKEDQQHQLVMVRVQCLEANSRLQRAADLARGEAGRHDDAARAILEQRAWQRILPILQRQTSYVETVTRAQELIAEAGRRGDLATLRAFATELPAYMEAHEPADNRARRMAAGKSFAETDGTTQRLLADVAAAGAPHLPPEERLANEIEQQLQPFPQAIEGNLARLQMLLDDPNGIYSNVGLVGWQPGTYIRAGSTIEEEAQPNGTSADLGSAPARAPGSVDPAHLKDNGDGTSSLTSLPQ